MSAFARPWRLAGAAIGALLLGAVAAQASEATMLAKRAGFLLGHAYRCGIADARLKRSTVLVGRLIGAYSLDDDDKDAAQVEFAQSVLAGALADRLADRLGDRLPSCAAVRAQLARFEAHGLPATTHQGETKMASDNRSGEAPRRNSAATKPAKSAKQAKHAKRATTQPEELTPERRAALALKREAQQLRGRPPSL